MPEDTLAGVLINMVLKKPFKSGQHAGVAAVRETTTRTVGQMHAWQLGRIHILEQIDRAVHAYETDIAQGTVPEAAMMAHFPALGDSTGQCTAYNSRCVYLPLCQMAGMEQRMMAGFRPKTLQTPDEVAQ